MEFTESSLTSKGRNARRMFRDKYQGSDTIQGVRPG